MKPCPGCFQFDKRNQLIAKPNPIIVNNERRRLFFVELFEHQGFVCILAKQEDCRQQQVDESMHWNNRSVVVV